jgi:CheY-like chemotaxis protein
LAPGGKRAPVCKLLIVDDHMDVRDALAELAEHEGHVHHEESNGADALAWLEAQAEPPCLVLLDLRMPVMDGWDFANALRSDPRWRDVGIIVISATIKQNAPHPLLPAKAFWTKPPDNAEIANLHRYCDKHREPSAPASSRSH